MSSRKKEHKRLYVHSQKENAKVGFGKYATRTFFWVAKNDLDYFRQIKTLYYSKYNVLKKKSYDSTFKRYCLIQDIYLNRKNEIIELCLSYRRSGTVLLDLKLILKEKYPEITEALIQDCIFETKNILKKEFEIEKDFLVDIHNLRYEELFEKACNPNLGRIPPQYHNSIKAESYLNAIDILSQKEKSLGIHSKNFKIQINNYLQLKQKKKTQVFNIELLSLEQQIELLQLIESCKANDIVHQPIIDNNQDTYQQVTVIKDEIEAPIRQSQQTDRLGDKEKEVSKTKGKNIYQLQQSIQETVKKQLEEALKKKKKK